MNLKFTTLSILSLSLILTMSVSNAFAGLTRGTSGTQIFNTITSTSDPGEPALCGFPAKNTEWYAIQADEDGIIIVSTTGSNYDTVLEVFYDTGTGVGLYDGLISRGCNDNCDGQTSEVRFQAKRGENYYIAVGTASGSGGSAKITYTLYGNTDVLPVSACSNYVDIGLKVQENNVTKSVAILPDGQSSPLKIYKNSKTYSVALVNPADPSALKTKIQTSAGIKALRNLNALNDLCSNVTCNPRCNAAGNIETGSCDATTGQCVYGQSTVCSTGCSNGTCCSNPIEAITSLPAGGQCGTQTCDLNVYDKCKTISFTPNTCPNTYECIAKVNPPVSCGGRIAYSLPSHRNYVTFSTTQQTGLSPHCPALDVTLPDPNTSYINSIREVEAQRYLNNCLNTNELSLVNITWDGPTSNSGTYTCTNDWICSSNPNAPAACGTWFSCVHPDGRVQATSRASDGSPSRVVTAVNPTLNQIVNLLSAELQSDLNAQGKTLTGFNVNNSSSIAPWNGTYTCDNTCGEIRYTTPTSTPIIGSKNIRVFITGECTSSPTGEYTPANETAEEVAEYLLGNCLNAKNMTGIVRWQTPVATASITANRGTYACAPTNSGDCTVIASKLKIKDWQQGATIYQSCDEDNLHWRLSGFCAAYFTPDPVSMTTANRQMTFSINDIQHPRNSLVGMSAVSISKNGTIVMPMRNPYQSGGFPVTYTHALEAGVYTVYGVVDNSDSESNQEFIKEYTVTCK